jgi:hypothetical protein
LRFVSASGHSKAVAAGIGNRKRAHHAVEHVGVVEQRLGLVVDEDQLGPLQPVQRALAGGVERTHHRRTERRERRVGGGLDDEHHRSRRRCDGHGLAPRVHTLHGDATLVAHESLALEPGSIHPKPEVEQRLDPSARPRHRDLAGEAKPRRAPRRPPLPSDVERCQLVEGSTGLDGEWAAGAVDQRRQPLSQLAGDAFLDEQAVVVHAAIIVVSPTHGGAPTFPGPECWGAPEC